MSAGTPTPIGFSAGGRVSIFKSTIFYFTTNIEKNFWWYKNFILNIVFYKEI
jgi:hypothetical protein